MLATSSPIQPFLEWAQRKDMIYLTIKVEDCKDPAFEFTEDKLKVSGHGGPDKHSFESNVEFYKPVDYTKARQIASDRCIQFVIPKLESGPFWPRLLKGDKKMHWLKVDFDKWKDEDDESEDEALNWDLNDMMGKMGGFGGAKPELDDMADDSDNEELPDLEDDKPLEENSAKEDHPGRADKGDTNSKIEKSNSQNGEIAA